MHKDFIAIDDFSSDELKHFLSLAETIKKQPEKFSNALDGKTLGMIFNKNSTRTRLSFEVGMIQLGGKGIFMGPNEMQLSRGETIEDTAKVLSRYLNGIMIRTFDHDDVLSLSKHSTIPVINGLTDFNHPCQALSDMLTLKEQFGRLEGLKLTYVGDSNNVVTSLLSACLKFGVHFAVVSPDEFSLEKEKRVAAEKAAHEKGLNFQFTDQISEGVKNSDAVYTDVWVSMGEDEHSEKKIESLSPFSVDDKLMKMAKPNAVFMHCLPAHRGQEVSQAVIDGAQSIVFDQAENRLHAQKAILKSLVQD